MTSKPAYTYIDPSHSKILEDKIRRYEKYTADLEHRLKNTEKLLSTHRQFIVQNKLKDEYTAWRVANRLEE